MDKTFEILCGIVTEETGLAELNAVPETVLAQLPGWDSVNMTCVILGVEKKFGFTFTPEEMDQLTTFEDFLQAIKAKS